MTKDEQVDSALLADVSSFQAELSAPSPAPLNAAPTSTDDGLLLASQYLLADTETLLSSLPSESQRGHEREAQEATQAKTSEHTKTSRNVTVEAKEKMSPNQQRELRNAQAAKRRLRHRLKLKEEKETLKRQEVELSDALGRLRRAEVAEGKRCRVDKMSISVWRAIAMRQREKRAGTEQTQRHLRAAVIGRARMIHQMTALLQASELTEETTMMSGEKAEGPRNEGDALFKTFTSELDVIYAQTGEVMREADFKLAPKLGYKPKRSQKQGEELFESADKTVIPFRFEDTRRAMSLLMMTDPEVLLHNPNLQEPKDTVTVRYTCDVDSHLEPGARAKLEVFAVVRKYKEADRAVFVWRALNEGQGDLSGYHTHETGWIVVRPEQSAPQSTVLESYVRFVPVSVTGAASSKVNKDQFAEVVAKSGEDEVSELMQMLEKMLLRDGSI
jgi:hypothetical protein